VEALQISWTPLKKFGEQAEPGTVFINRAVKDALLNYILRFIDPDGGSNHEVTSSLHVFYLLRWVNQRVTARHQHPHAPHCHHHTIIIFYLDEGSWSQKMGRYFA
jgi:hypothetical protein